MTPIALWFDAASPRAREVFTRWADDWAALGAGHGVVCSCHPVAAAPAAGLDGDAVLRMAWAAASEGLAPSRWVCERLLAGDVQALREAARRDPEDPQVSAALRDARDALPRPMHDGHAWRIAGQWHVGDAQFANALRAMQGLTARD